MQWCVAGLLVSILALIAGIFYASIPMLIYALVTGPLWVSAAWFGRQRGWFQPW